MNYYYAPFCFCFVISTFRTTLKAHLYTIKFPYPDIYIALWNLFWYFPNGHHLEGGV